MTDEPEGLQTARALALYGLSLVGAASASLAWPSDPEDATTRVVVLAVALVLALVFGDRLSGRLLAVLERRTLSRLRFAVGAAHLAFVFVALLLAIGTALPRILATETLLFAALQVALVLLADVLGGHVPAVTNALALTVLAALAGGSVAAVAVTVYLGLLVYFVTFDHFVRRISAYPAARADLLAVAVSQASAIAVPLVVGIFAFLGAAPPTPYTRIAFDLAPSATPQEIEQSLARLVLLALLGGVVVLGLRRALGGGAVHEPPSDEIVLPERGPEEPLAGSQGGRKRSYAGRRGRIVRAYVRFLTEVERRGFLRRPAQTPAVIAEEIHGAPSALERLTVLFMDARYGPDDPGEDGVREAEAAARTAVASYEARRDPQGSSRGPRVNI